MLSPELVSRERPEEKDAKRVGESEEDFPLKILTKEQKKALLNFRDQVQYKDYRGLVKTLRALKEVAESKTYVIPVKYIDRYNMLKETLLLLKNIVISDIKYVVSSKKRMASNTVEIASILSEKYGYNIKHTIVTWISNSFIERYSPSLKGVVKLSDVAESLALLEDLKDKIEVEYSYLPIWWNIGGSVITDLSIVLKSEILKIVSQGSFTDSEYTGSLDKVIAFEKKYLVVKFKEEQAVTGGTDPLSVLEDISNELSPVADERMSSNVLSSAFLPSIGIFVREGFSLAAQLSLSLSEREPSYLLFNEVAQILSRLLYFKNTGVFAVFLQEVDKHVAGLLRETALPKKTAVITSLEISYYIKETMLQLTEKLRVLSTQPCISCTLTLQELLRIEDALSQQMKKETKQFIKRFKIYKGLGKGEVEKDTELLIPRILDDLSFISDTSNKAAIFHAYTTSLSDLLLANTLSIPLSREASKSFLIEISKIENVLHKEELKLCTSARSLNPLKLYLKIFLIDPSEVSLFVINFNKISNGIFLFKQVLERLEDKRYNEQLMDAYIPSSPQP